MIPGKDTPRSSLWVRVTPRSATDRVTSWDGETLALKVKAPPVEGKANEACRDLLASYLGLPRSKVRLLDGAAARRKRFELTGLTVETLRIKLARDFPLELE
ncbi:MAG: DUF167 domain-containing protein [Firmicutes bacterium]|nr:DUF167 domain-containing protein [Bacillota bacterium]